MEANDRRKETIHKPRQQNAILKILMLIIMSELFIKCIFDKKIKKIMIENYKVKKDYRTGLNKNQNMNYDM